MQCTTLPKIVRFVFYENKSFQSGLALYIAHLCGIFVPGYGVLIFNEEQRILCRVSAVYEYVYLCRLHGICDSQSAVVSLSSPVSLSAGIDGQCQALVLWNLHAG